MNNSALLLEKGDTPCAELPPGKSDWQGLIALEIEAPVGTGPRARNLPQDVLTVRDLFNRVSPARSGPLPLLKMTDRFDEELLEAIYRFQGRWLRYYGGLIQPGGRTMDLLNFGDQLPLVSKLFRRDPVLESILVESRFGDFGRHIGKVQTALFILEGVSVDSKELGMEEYGPSTVDAILAYKRKHRILSAASHSEEGEYFSRFTVVALDAEMARYELLPDPRPARNTFAWTTSRGR